MTPRHAPHTRCHVGKRVFVGLRDGQQFTDVFERETNTAVVLRQAGKIPKRQLRFMTIARGEGTPCTDSSREP